MAGGAYLSTKPNLNDILKKTRDRRLDRRQDRRVSNIETLTGSTFTQTSDVVGAILSAEIAARKSGLATTPQEDPRPRLPMTESQWFGSIDRERRNLVQVETSSERTSTNFVDEVNYTVSTKFKLVETSRRGRLRELSIRSPSSNFTITVITDGLQQFSRSYTEFQTLSPHSTLIDAFEDSQDGTYVLHIDEISWRNNATIILRALESITFENIFVVFEEFLI